MRQGQHFISTKTMRKDSKSSNVQWGNLWNRISGAPCRIARREASAKAQLRAPTWEDSKRLRSPNPVRPAFPPFLIEMNDGLSQEDEGGATIMCMDESVVHQLHSSAYSYFQRDKAGVVHDGLGRTSGKSQRMTMVHAIISYSNPVTTAEGSWLRES